MTRHAVNWFEIPAQTSTARQRFYQSLLGTTLKARDDGREANGRLPGTTGEAAAGGCLHRGPSRWRRSRDGTRVYLDASPSIDAALDRCRRGGRPRGDAQGGAAARHGRTSRMSRTAKATWSACTRWPEPPREPPSMRRADRLFQLVQLIRGRRLSTGDWLAERLAVSLRTVYRDVADLQAQGVPIEGEAGVGYRMRAGFDLPPLMFTPTKPRRSSPPCASRSRGSTRRSRPQAPRARWRR